MKGLSEGLPDSCDVAVVGSGVAGLAAGVEAADRGAEVIVLEGAEVVGGASVMSGAYCCLVDTPLQRRLGIEDSVELALEDWARVGGPTADMAWARRYVQDSATQVYAWCEGLGITWDDVLQPEGNSVPRWHTPVGWGRTIIAVIRARAEALGVTILTETSVRQLCLDDGVIEGVVVSQNGRNHHLRAAAVVMATGGFAADHDMLLRHAPQLRDVPRLLAGSAPTSRGSGHRLLEEVGAQFVALDHVWVYPTGTPDPTYPSGTRGLGLRGPTTEIWLNREGLRFHDENQRGAMSGGRALREQPGQTAWCVFNAHEVDRLLLIDNEQFGTPAGPNPEAVSEFLRTSPYVRHGDTPEQLACGMGLPPDAVCASLNDFNRAIRAGGTTEPAFGRDLEGLEELSGPGLLAVQLFPLAQKTFGGVRTDQACRVLSTLDGLPIPGLLAAGELAGMAGGCINGRAALEGTMFGPSLYSGRLAGRAAAAHSDPSVPLPGRR